MEKIHKRTYDTDKNCDPLSVRVGDPRHTKPKLSVIKQRYVQESQIGAQRQVRHD
jgi:hypothetical protein